MKDREEPIAQNPWEIMERLLNDLKKRLDEFEERIRRLETGQTNIILDETAIAESEGLLGGKTLASVSGSIKKFIRLPVCDSCGRRLGEDFTLCSKCGRKVCDQCVITLNAKSLCPQCFSETVPITKSDAKVLLCFACGMRRGEAISEITGLSTREVRSSKLKLMQLELMRKRGVSFLAKVELSEQGREAAEALRRIYRKDRDFAKFVQILAEKVRRNEVEVQGNDRIRLDNNHLPGLAPSSYRNKLVGSGRS